MLANSVANLKMTSSSLQFALDFTIPLSLEKYGRDTAMLAFTVCWMNWQSTHAAL